jgi:PST family polysaccharide transporter
MPLPSDPGGEESPTLDLRGRAVRGGAVTFVSQAVKVVLNVGSTLILARLLTPADYGLIGTVAGVTGFVETFKDAGLSMATIQRERITDEQISTLFWLNVTLSVGLMLFVAALAPIIALFFHEPRLTWVTVALAVTFPLSGLTVQHQALMRRNMRFRDLTAIELASVAAGAVSAVVMGWLGFRYWALVSMAIVTALVNVVAVWLAMPWRPGPAVRGCGVRPMIGFGGNIVASRFVASFVRNLPSILLGRFWGTTAVGLYQRAYALLMFAVDQVQGPVTAVAIAPLSRLQSDSERLRRFFLVGYGVVVSCILPIVVTSAVYSEGIVTLLLGRQWLETARIFRWLALSGIFVGIMNPQGMLLLAMGRTTKFFKLGVADGAAAVISYIVGVPYGPEGIAASYLLVKAIIVLPMAYATFKDTPVSFKDVVSTIQAPIIASGVAAALGWTVKVFLADLAKDWVLTVAGCSVMLLAYALTLLFALGKWSLYSGIFAELFQSRKPARMAQGVLLQP